MADNPPPDAPEATTAAILRSTAHALRAVRNCLDLLATDTSDAGMQLHLQLRNAVIGVCQQTNRVIFDPAYQPARSEHAAVVDHLLTTAAVAVAYLQNEEP